MASLIKMDEYIEMLKRKQKETGKQPMPYKHRNLAIYPLVEPSLGEFAAGIDLGDEFVAKYKCYATHEECYKCNPIYTAQGTQIGSHCVKRVCDMEDIKDCPCIKEEKEDITIPQKYPNIADLVLSKIN